MAPSRVDGTGQERKSAGSPGCQLQPCPAPSRTGVPRCSQHSARSQRAGPWDSVLGTGRGGRGFPQVDAWLGGGSGLRVARKSRVRLVPGRIPSSLDNSLLHAIETIIIDWSHQIRDVLSKDSAQALLDGLNPLPQVEFEFWDARLMNLKCIHEQVGRLGPGPTPQCRLPRVTQTCVSPLQPPQSGCPHFRVCQFA